jgi:hypothetical protein
MRRLWTMLTHRQENHESPGAGYVLQPSESCQNLWQSHGAFLASQVPRRHSLTRTILQWGAIGLRAPVFIRL